jgi:hypothetical protein
MHRTHKYYTQPTNFCKHGTKNFCTSDVVSNVTMLMNNDLYRDGGGGYSCVLIRHFIAVFVKGD